MYQKGRNYVWQNLSGRWAYLNGCETTVTEGMVIRGGAQSWMTPTPHPTSDTTRCVAAYINELRPKSES